MTKEEIINRLQELNYPQSEYWLLTGGAMVLYDIKDSTNDIDLGCSKLLADMLESEGYPTVVLSDRTRKITVAKDVEIFEEWLFDKVEVKYGIPIISVKGLLEMKKCLGREKDFADIKLIEAALYEQRNRGRR